MLLESSQNSSIKGSDILYSILVRNKLLEKVVKVTVKENEQGIKKRLNLLIIILLVTI